MFSHIKLLVIIAFMTCLCILNTVIYAQESRQVDIRPPGPEAKPTISPEESEKRLQDAILLYKRGKTEAAIYALQQLEKADPTNYRVLFKLGELAIADRNWAYAIEVFRKASYLRPKDIEVRLILMDIFRAYQMPIQEIEAGREIIGLEPAHLTANRRLAKLYQDQAMQEDEIQVRLKLKRLVPDDYQNLKRLADIYDGEGLYWESAKVYEQIRKYHPEKVIDATRMAALYDKVGETFRGLEVLDHTAKRGGKSPWLRGRAKRKQRVLLDVWDHFEANTTFRSEESDELETTSILFESEYMHIRPRSWYDFGGQVKYGFFDYKGVGVVDGSMEIHSATATLGVLKNWRGEDYRLLIKAGATWEDVSNKIRARDPNSGINERDVALLENRSYGGTEPVGNLRFIAKPGLYASYEIDYEHGLVDDLDARIRMYYFDKATLSYRYKSNDLTEFLLQTDGSIISDDNVRFHALASAYYTILASGAMRDYRGKRKDFFRNPPLHFLKAGGSLEYFNDNDTSSLYGTYENEIQYMGKLESQTRLFSTGPDSHIFIKVHAAYKVGDKTLDHAITAGGGLVYQNYENGNQIGLLYNYEREDSGPGDDVYYLKEGRWTGHAIILQIEWRFR
jgi:tetratricopeptide (TPR) repeat protein